MENEVQVVNAPEGSSLMSKYHIEKALLPQTPIISFVVMIHPQWALYVTG